MSSSQRTQSTVIIPGRAQQGGYEKIIGKDKRKKSHLVWTLYFRWCKVDRHRRRHRMRHRHSPCCCTRCLQQIANTRSPCHSHFHPKAHADRPVPSVRATTTQTHCPGRVAVAGASEAASPANNQFRCFPTRAQYTEAVECRRCTSRQGMVAWGAWVTEVCVEKALHIGEGTWHGRAWHRPKGGWCN